jgi:hypothetical protein
MVKNTPFLPLDLNSITGNINEKITLDFPDVAPFKRCHI